MRLSERIRYVGMNDMQTALFEHQWPLPFGVSYNSYLVIDERIALIDTAAAAFKEEFLSNIEKEIGERRIDYLVVNHMEPDHSALQNVIREKYPDCTIVTNAKAVPMVGGYQGITDNILVVKEGESLSLGGCSLQFFMAPMVHWPETMVTWCPEEKTLFSGDAFGCFKSIDNEKVTDQFEDYRDEMARYYASIVGKYGQPVQTALKKVLAIDVARICPTHGPVWEDDLRKAVGFYDRLSATRLERGVCLAYGSMYGNTAKAAEAIAQILENQNIIVKKHDLCEENYSFALADVFLYDSLIVGAPTYNAGIFPPVQAFMEALKARNVKNRKFAAFGSFTWAGMSVKLLNGLAAEMQFELVHEGLSFAQGYSKEKFAADEIARSFIF